MRCKMGLAADSLVRIFAVLHSVLCLWKSHITLRLCPSLWIREKPASLHRAHGSVGTHSAGQTAQGGQPVSVDSLWAPDPPLSQDIMRTLGVLGAKITDHFGSTTHRWQDQQQSFVLVADGFSGEHLPLTQGFSTKVRPETSEEEVRSSRPRWQNVPPGLLQCEFGRTVPRAPSLYCSDPNAWLALCASQTTVTSRWPH